MEVVCTALIACCRSLFLVKGLISLKFIRSAHGRPTMTHIMNLQHELLKDERNAAELISAPTVGVNLSQQPGDDGPQEFK